MEEHFLKQLNEAVERNYSNPYFGAEELARELGVSYSTLRRRYTALTGKPLMSLISGVRLKKAWNLLQDPSVAVSEVARLTGFGSATYFSKTFREHFGYPPVEARGRERPEKVGLVPGVPESAAPELPPDERKTGNPVLPGIRTGKSRLMRRLVSSVEVMVLLAAVLVLLLTSGVFRTRESIAVLPFRTIGGSDTTAAIYTDGLWFQTIISLDKPRGFEVRSAVSTAKYRNTNKSMSEIGKELGVDYILDGSVEKQGEDIRVFATLIDTRSDGNRWTEEWRFRQGDTFLQLAEIGKFVSYKLSVVLKPREIEQMTTKCTKSATAWNFWLQGSYFLGSNHFIPERAIPFLEKAIEADTTWADAYLSLAQGYSGLMKSDPRDEYMLKRIRAIEKAMECRPDANTIIALATHHLSLGETRKAGECFRRASELSPNEVANNLSMVNNRKTFGEWKEGHGGLHRLVDQMPGNWSIHYHLGYSADMMRNYPDATVHYKQGSIVAPDIPYFYIGLAECSVRWEGDVRRAREIILDSNREKLWLDDCLAQSYYYYALFDLYEGKYQDAITWIGRQFKEVLWEPPFHCRPKPLMFAMAYGYAGDTALSRAYYDSTRIFLQRQQENSLASRQSPRVNGALGMAWMGLGNREEALRSASRVEELLQENPNAFSGPFAMEDVAWIYLQDRQYQKGFRILRNLLANPGPLTTKILEIDPRWAPFRKRAEFRKLVKRYAPDDEGADSPVL